MVLIESLLAHLPPEPVPVREVVIGLRWTMVTSKYSGLASTLSQDESAHGKKHLIDAGNLQNRTAQELAEGIRSSDLLEASIGMAAINSLLDLEDSQAIQINAADILAREAPGKNLAIIGHFPFVQRMKSIAHNCWVIEKNPQDDDLPESAAETCLPQSDLVAITGTALINHTLTHLLSLCNPTAKIMLLGPSSPLTPLLFDFGISFISGSRVKDADAVRRTITQGAIFPQVQGVKLLTLEKDGIWK